jgi:hypothetical protein
MIILQNISQLDNAFKKANKVKPEVTILEFGRYQVKGTKGDRYIVTCRTDPDGQRLIYCSCEEKIARKQGTICYHAAPAFGVHLFMALAKRSVVGNLDPQINWLKFIHGASIDLPSKRSDV